MAQKNASSSNALNLDLLSLDKAIVPELEENITNTGTSKAHKFDMQNRLR